MALKWEGDRVKRRARDAQIYGVNKTMAQCVEYAKAHHKFKNVTGTAEGSIRIVNFAIPHRRGARGVWGSADVIYFRRLELGFDGVDSAGRVVHQPPYPSLRPAADAIYPNLPENIAEGLRR